VRSAARGANLAIAPSRARAISGDKRAMFPQAATSAAQKNGQIMAAEKQQSLQDAFLNHVRKNKTPLTIFLVNGVKLQGIVTWFDNFCVLLRRDGHSQLVYKHAISTIMPGGPISFLDGDQNEER